MFFKLIKANLENSHFATNNTPKFPDRLNWVRTRDTFQERVKHKYNPSLFTIMSVLETAIVLDGSILVEKQFCAEKTQTLIKNRADLILAITSMAENAFGDEIQNFRVGDFEIVFISKEVKRLDDPDYPCHIYLYTIANTSDKTDKKALNEKMEAALFQFTNRFSTIDILAKNTSLFIPFSDRFDNIFKGLIYRTDEEMVQSKKKKEKSLKEMRQIAHAQQSRARHANSFRRI